MPRTKDELAKEKERTAIVGMWMVLWFFMGCISFLIALVLIPHTTYDGNGYPVGTANYGPMFMFGAGGIGCWFMACCGAAFDGHSEYTPPPETSTHSTPKYEMRNAFAKSACPSCHGSTRCTSCGGSGVIGGPLRARQLNNNHDYRHQHDCMICGGTGCCMTCSGAGTY